MMLTTALDQAYPLIVTAKSVAGCENLKEAAESRKLDRLAAFFVLPGVPFMAGRAGKPQGLPVPHRVLTPVSVCHPSVRRGMAVIKTAIEAHIMTNTPLVPVFTGAIQNQSVQLCNARDLHQFLEIGTKFADWINGRIKQYGFIQGEDYFLNSGNRSDNKPGRGRTEYHLTLDMAKELAMVENNDKGRQIRRYFISLERKAINSRKTRSLSSKKYHYPRNRLEQPYFAEKKPASLSLSMLANTKEFTSQLKALLNELRTDGHNVDAAWDEYQAMDEIIRHCDGFMDEVIELALAKKLNYSNYSLRNK